MKRKAGSQSAGYHYDATPKHPAPTKTRVVAPPPSEAARGPAGDYKGASSDYTAAVEALPAKAQRVTEQATRSAARRQARARKQRTRAILQSGKPKAQKAAQRLKTQKPKKYKAPVLPKDKPKVFQGRKTAGTPTLEELKKSRKANTLQVNRKGAVTTPKVRVAARRLKKAKRAIAQAAPARGPLPGLGPEESHNAKVVLRKGEKSGADHKELLAAAETGLVESGFKNYRNQAETDADSLGWRQERVSQYGADATNVKKGAKNFFTETKTDTGGTRGRGMTAGQLAQTVQGSAFPERYDQVKPQAQALLSAYKQGKATPKQVKRLKAAEAQAKASGLKPKQTGPPPKKVVTRYKASVAAEKQLEKAHLPYVWGGGHNAGKVEPGSGLDCSGTVSYVLQHMGVKLPGGVVSGEMGHYLKPGPGAVTVFYNGEHTFLYDAKAGKYFGTSESNPGGGAGFFPKSVGDAEVASGNSAGAYQVGHVPGLGKKQAIQLGAIPGSFPGMNLSSSGTTATIEQGAGATVEKPGFSKKPIKLTPRQKVNRAERKLKALSSPQAPKESTSTTLDALEKKYASAAA